MAVITVSRLLGSQGDEIAMKVAEALGLRLIDAETIHRAAQRAGVPHLALAELQHEGEHGLANQVLKALRAMPSLPTPYAISPLPAAGEDSSCTIADESAPAASAAAEPVTAFPGQSAFPLPFTGLFSPTVPPISSSLEEYVRMVGLVIRGLAREGNVLIIGRGGQILLRKHPSALHVQIVAPFEHRLQVIMSREGLNRRAAQNRLRASDRARFDYVRRYYDADWLDPTLYHLVLNTGRMPVATAVGLIISAYHALGQPAGRDRSDE